MKDMNFPIDFIWIYEGKIVDQTENVLPPDQTNNQPQVVSPKEEVDQVLEVNAGFIKNHKIQIGDVVNSN